MQPGQHVLINGASGGVGTFAVQFAKWLGAHVTGVCSAGNAEMVTSIGADRVIDYARENFTQGDERYDVIVDNVGSQSFFACRRVLISWPWGKCARSSTGATPSAKRRTRCATSKRARAREGGDYR